MGQLVITAFLLRSYVIVVRRFIQGETFPNSHCIVTDSSKALQNSLTSNLGTARVTVVESLWHKMVSFGKKSLIVLALIYWQGLGREKKSFLVRIIANRNLPDDVVLFKHLHLHLFFLRDHNDTSILRKPSSAIDVSVFMLMATTKLSMFYNGLGACKSDCTNMI